MAPNPAMTIVVSSNTLLREGLARVLSGASFPGIVSLPGLDCLDPKAISAVSSALIIVDVDSEFQTKIQKLKALRSSNATARIAIFGERIKRIDIVTALRAGVNACFARVSACDVFIKSLELVMLGESVVQPVRWALNVEDGSASPSEEDRSSVSASERSIEPGDKIAASPMMNGAALSRRLDRSGLADGLPALSPRQHFILRCLVQGDSNKLIARKIAVSEGTVKAHLKVLLRKMRVRNRTQAAIWALSHQPYLARAGDEGRDGEAIEPGPH